MPKQMTRQDFKDLVTVVVCVVVVVLLVFLSIVMYFGWKIFFAFIGLILALFAFYAVLHYISKFGNYILDKIYDRYISGKG